MELCPLCNTKSRIFYHAKNRVYFVCPVCQGIFLEKRALPDEMSEKERYKEHNNDVTDIRYQNFVSPIVNAILNDFSPHHAGLDFGAGTGPVISKMLEDKNFYIAQYDPFFYNYPELLDNTYDYIAACEVIEHFHNPAKEFALLKSLLKPGGKLYCMTTIFNHTIDFKTWNYKDDPTHVFFYQEATFAYIKKTFGFNHLIITGHVIILSC